MPKRLRLVSVLMILIIWVLYVHMLSPSPLLMFIRDWFGIVNNEALLNQAVSIIYPAVILACIAGGILEQKIGTKNLFLVTLVFATVGLSINFVASNYWIFLIGRFIFGIGFGLSIPFIGSAIMNWYSPEERYKMSTINGLFPFLGSLVAFGLIVPLYNLFGNSITVSLGVWAIPCVAVLLIWNSLFDKTPHQPVAATSAEPAEKGLYVNLLKRKNIFLLCMCFVCDFWCFSYLGVVQPTYIFEISNGTLSEATAGILSAFAMPVLGIAVCMVGGTILARTGKRKPTVILGQVLKFAGYLVMALASLAGGNMAVFLALVGSGIFGMGTALWLPSMYTMPTELPGMNSQRVGAAFGIISAFGYLFGFVSPIVGGVLTDMFMADSGIADPMANHVYGLRWSLFAFAFINLLSFGCSLLLDETGPGKTIRQESEILPDMHSDGVVAAVREAGGARRPA